MPMIEAHDGTRLYAKSWGEGPPVVLIHGWPLSGDSWDPIAHALAWPARMAASVPPLDLIALGKLEFFAPDPVRFPALRLSREALCAGGGAPTILNAANEIAVGLFLEKRLRFLDIAVVVEETLSRLGAPEAADLAAIMAHDGAARSQAGLIAAERAALV